MNQAAQTAKRSPEFAASYTAIAKQRGKKISRLPMPWESGLDRSRLP
jgi:hypothetical protein